jgi:HPt (histidine-containing phosphotransfer) domain-containing protein
MDRLIDFGGGSLESVREIVDLYLRQTAGQLEQLRQAAQQGDAEVLDTVAHSCAGASATCGMSGMVPILRRLEQAGKEVQLESAESLLQDAVEEFSRIRAFVERTDWTQGGETEPPQSIAI